MQEQQNNAAPPDAHAGNFGGNYLLVLVLVYKKCRLCHQPPLRLKSASIMYNGVYSAYGGGKPRLPKNLMVYQDALRRTILVINDYSSS